MEDRHITTNAMLRNVMSKLGLREVADLPVHDIIIWMSEALGHIGGYTSLEETTKTVSVSNYMGKYPQDLYAIVRIVGYPVFKSVRNGFIIEDDAVDVDIIYQRFPLDDEGFPMFPNDSATKDAMVWYVAQYLSIQDKLPNKKLSPQYCDSQWQWYCGQARAEGFTPTIDQWERMVNIFYRLIPKKDEYANYFGGLNHPEDLTLDSLNNYSNGRNQNNI